MKKEFYIENLSADSELDKIEIDLITEIKHSVVKLNKDKQTIMIDAFTNDFSDFDIAIEIFKRYDESVNLVEKPIEQTYRKVLILEGLDCANCSAKIERIAKRSLNHELISVDFATERFIIETKDKELAENIVKVVQSIASTVDNNVIVTTKAKAITEDEKGLRIAKRDKLYFIIGVSFFIFGVLVKNIYQRIAGITIPDYIIILAYGIAYVLLARDVIISAIKNIINGRVFDEKFLMTLATIVALLIGYYEEAVSVMIFYKVGQLLQDYAVNKSRRSIASLMDIRPTHANLIVNGDVVEVNPVEVLVDDIILVKSGERIPLDGVVVEGESALDVSALTGESKYLDVEVGSEVISGSISTNGMLKIKVVNVYEESMITKILDMVENASSLKSKSENYISKFAKYYTPIVCILALLLALSPFLTIENPAWSNFQDSIYNAMVFLVASCPCALVISIPLGFFGGIGGASRHGILVKGSNYLEALGNIGSIAFDKTGTLTTGVFTIEEIVPISGTVDRLLEVGAYGEAFSTHPIGTSIVREYGQERIDTSRITIHPKSTKTGIRIYLDGKDVAIGNDKYMKKLKINYTQVDSSGVVVHIVEEQVYLGYIILKDEVRPEAKQVVEEIKKLGIEVAMFTGDKEEVALEVGKYLGIDNVYFEMTPVDKVKRLRKLKLQLHGKSKQVFIGDGINDAPVLGSADVGIAMGGLGSDAAIKVADVVLMNDDLTKIPTIIQIAKKTKRIVLQNVILALLVKIIVLSLAPFGLSYMWEAIFADVGVSLIAIINSLTAAKIKK
jgi:Cd2+/Zn2+-exporting ATPase